MPPLGALEPRLSRTTVTRRLNDRAVIDADEPLDGEPPDPFSLDDEDETEAPRPSWLGAVGQMIAALLAVVALVALFIGVAAILRRVLP